MTESRATVVVFDIANVLLQKEDNLVFVEAFVDTTPVTCARPVIRRAQPAEIEIEKLFVITPQNVVEKLCQTTPVTTIASKTKSPGGGDGLSIPRDVADALGFDPAN